MVLWVRISTISCQLDEIVSVFFVNVLASSYVTVQLRLQNLNINYYSAVFSYRYPYMAVVLNFSQMWALYCLVQFYDVTHEGLKHIKPLAKFISFKAIVFATW